MTKALVTGGAAPLVHHRLPRAGDVRHSLADIARARAAFVYQPRPDSAGGLREYLDWARAGKV